MEQIDKLRHIHIIMPMAGFGTRTSDKYSCPKPFINIYDKFLFEYALEGLLHIAWEFHIKLTMIMREEMLDPLTEIEINRKIWNINWVEQFNIIKLDNPTRGSLETVMKAEHLIDDSDICIILDCDLLWYRDVYSIMRRIDEDLDIDGFLFSFKSDKDKYSYANITDNNIVTRTAEKQVISEHALAGVYGFSEGSMLKQYARYVLNRPADYNEYYVSALYNYMIADGARIKLYDLDIYTSLGTTEEINEFKKSDNDYKHLYITDFDGTLVDTREANYLAYNETFKKICDYDLTEEEYNSAFGLRINELLEKLNIPLKYLEDIKKTKSEVYKKYFDKIKLNRELVNSLWLQQNDSNIIALATTASKENVHNILKHFELEDFFDYIITGEDVKNGKPDPEVYYKVMKEYWYVDRYNVHIYEDSDVGILAAINSGINKANIEIVNKFK